jgi:hypothetical protein
MAVWAFLLRFSFLVTLLVFFLPFSLSPFLPFCSLSYRRTIPELSGPPRTFCLQKIVERAFTPKTLCDAWSELDAVSAIAGLPCYTVNQRTKLTFRAHHTDSIFEY